MGAVWSAGRLLPAKEAHGSRGRDGKTEHEDTRSGLNLTFSPRVVIPLVFGVGVIGYLLGYADVGRVLQAAGAFQPIYLLLILLCTGAYEALRSVQWLFYLRSLKLGERVPWRAALMSFMGGELAKMLPGGQYFQTYLLRRAGGVPIASSAAATTIVIWLEVIVCLALLLVFGVGHWTWVRPAALVLLLVVAAAMTLLKRRPLADGVRHTLRRFPRLSAAWAWYDGFAVSAGELLGARVLGIATALSAGYIACAGMALWAIAAALGVKSIGPGQGLIVYCFALACSLAIPIPIDLGLTEASGLAALLALGVGRADALTIMLMQRVLTSVLTSGIAGVTLALLRNQMGAAMRAEVSGAGEPEVSDASEPDLRSIIEL